MPLANVPIRPLNKGMFRNLPPNGIPTGGFLRAQNYRVREYGLERRNGFSTFESNSSGAIQAPVIDIIHFYRRSLESQTLYVTEKSLFTREGANLTKHNITYPTTITTNTAGPEAIVTIVDTGDLYVNLRRGDYITVGTTNYLVDGYSYTELAGTYTYLVTVLAPLSIDELVGACTVVYNFYVDGGLNVTSAIMPVEGTGADDSLVFADQADRGLYKYDTSGTFDLYPIDSSVGGATTPVYTNIVSGRVITYFADRLWMANTVEVDGEHRQRIRWSDVRAFDRFQFENYLDLPYTEGECLALVPLGSFVVAYFEDAIYFGRATNLAGLPYAFTRMETGNVGPLSQTSITAWTDMHYFVGQDDIYSFSEATGLTPIGAPIISESLDFSKELNLDLQYKTKATHDLETESVVFVIPDYYDPAVDLSGPSERVWRYFYKTGAWAYDEVYFNNTDKTDPAYLFMSVVPSQVYLYGRTWQQWIDLDPGLPEESILARWTRDGYVMDEGDAFDDYPTWDALIQEQRLPRTMKISVWVPGDSKIVILEEARGEPLDTVDSMTYPIWSVLESPDFDLGQPDVTKTFNRLSAKSFQNRVDRYTGARTQVDQLTFTVYLSDDMGYSFKRPYTMRWRNNYNEGKIDFRSTGSTIRFKLIASEEAPSFKLSEFVLRATGRGLQIQV